MALMSCPECSKQISDKAAACPNCGCPAVAKPLHAVSDQEERIIMKGLCNRVISFFNIQNGKAILTNHRFIYLKHSFAKTFALGLFINLTAGDFEFDIPIDDIENIMDERRGINNTIIINTKDGYSYNFYFTKREEWKIAFYNVMNNLC